MLAERLTYSLLFLCVAFNGHAQDSLTLSRNEESPSLLLRDYQFVKHADAWLTSHNAAGLTSFRSQNIAQAELSVNYATGRLVDFGGAVKTLQADVHVESFYRINPRTIVFGQVGYTNHTGRHMTGSAFMPSSTRHLPFDIVEDSLTNEGTKHRDTYELSGAVGIDMGRGVSLGIRMDYTAANYAKYKDLRHKNKLMDMVLSAGILAEPTQWLSIGADYLYHRRTESVSFSLYGREDKVYKSFINYGPFIGKVEQFGNYGLTDKTREMPLADDYNGFGLQMAVDFLPSLSFYHQFTYLQRKGYYGRKSPYTITYTNHHSKVYSWNGELMLSTKAARHSLTADVSIENLENNFQSYRELRDQNDVSYYEYYDPVKTGNRLWVNSSLTYTGHYGIRHELPTWTVTASFSNDRRKQTAYFYPFFRRQDLSARKINGSITRNIVLQQGIWSVMLNAGFQKGSGEPCEDGTFVQPSSKQTEPATMEPFFWQDYHLLTAPQYHLGLQLKYSFHFPGTQLLTYIRGDFQYRKANSLQNEYCGRDRAVYTMALGSTF